MSESLKVCCELLANSQHIIEEKNKEIARLVAEVERHRMTEEERGASVDAIACCEDITYGGPADASAADVLRNYLDRTAPPAAS